MLALSFFSACTTQQEEEFEAAVNTDEVKIMPKITDVLLDPISTRAGGRVALRFVMEAWQLDADNTTKMVVRRELKTENTYGATFTFEVEPVESLPELFHKVIFDELQMNRGDVIENMIRSTQTRVKYASETFPIFNAPAIIKRGDVMVESSEHGHYAGEVQIAKADMENTGLTNVIGHVREEELFLLDDLRPWQKFRFVEK